MKLSHEEYLKQVLKSKEAELKAIDMEHRIAIAEYNTKKKMIYEQINSIEKQLGN